MFHITLTLYHNIPYKPYFYIFEISTHYQLVLYIFLSAGSDHHSTPEDPPRSSKKAPGSWLGYRWLWRLLETLVGTTCAFQHETWCVLHLESIKDIASAWCGDETHSKWRWHVLQLPTTRRVYTETSIFYKSVFDSKIFVFWHLCHLSHKHVHWNSSYYKKKSHKLLLVSSYLYFICKLGTSSSVA